MWAGCSKSSSWYYVTLNCVLLSDINGADEGLLKISWGAASLQVVSRWAQKGIGRRNTKMNLWEIASGMERWIQLA